MYAIAFMFLFGAMMVAGSSGVLALGMLAGFVLTYARASQ